MADFGGIQNLVLRQLEMVMPNYPDQLLVEMPDAVNETIRDMCDIYAFTSMKGEAAFTTADQTSAGTRSHDLGARPADWLRPRADAYVLRFDGGTKIIPWLPTEEDRIREFGEAPTGGNDLGQPVAVRDDGANLQVWPFPNNSSDYADKNFRLRFPYYKYLSTLASAADSNWFTEKHPVMTRQAVVGKLLARVAHQAAGRFALGMLPLQSPQNETDMLFKRAVRSDKLSQLPTHHVLIPRRDAKGGYRQIRGV